MPKTTLLAPGSSSRVNGSATSWASRSAKSAKTECSPPLVPTMRQNTKWSASATATAATRRVPTPTVTCRQRATNFSNGVAGSMKQAARLALSPRPKAVSDAPQTMANTKAETAKSALSSMRASSVNTTKSPPTFREDMTNAISSINAAAHIPVM